uniref:hypothetical protein n=1 Tax=Klebsiella oxytoca TaxID=571 RepID=UPI0019538E43
PGQMRSIASGKLCLIVRSAPGKYTEADASRLALRLVRLLAGSQSHTAERDISFSYTFSPYIDPAYVESMMNY